MYFWRLEIQDQSVSRLDFSLSLLYTLHTVAFLLNPQRTHGILPWCLFMCLVSLSYETQASLDYDPSRKPYFKLIPSLKASFSKCHHILSYWKLWSSIWIGQGDTVQCVTTTCVVHLCYQSRQLWSPGSLMLFESELFPFSCPSTVIHAFLFQPVFTLAILKG